MTFCTGDGNLTTGGCCWVNGEVCPFRWRVEDGVVYDRDDNVLGDLAEAARRLTPAGEQRVVDQLEGVTWACKVALRIIGNNQKALNDRPFLEDQWRTDPEYVEQVRPAWAAIEERMGMEPGSFNCSTWQGGDPVGCCFGRTAEETEEHAVGLHPDGRKVRKAGGV